MSAKPSQPSHGGGLSGMSAKPKPPESALPPPDPMYDPYQPFDPFAAIEAPRQVQVKMATHNPGNLAAMGRHIASRPISIEELVARGKFVEAPTVRLPGIEPSYVPMPQPGRAALPVPGAVLPAPPGVYDPYADAVSASMPAYMNNFSTVETLAPYAAPGSFPVAPPMVRSYVPAPAPAPAAFATGTFSPMVRSWVPMEGVPQTTVPTAVATGTFAPGTFSPVVRSYVPMPQGEMTSTSVPTWPPMVRSYVPMPGTEAATAPQMVATTGAYTPTYVGAPPPQTVLSAGSYTAPPLAFVRSPLSGSFTGSPTYGGALSPTMPRVFDGFQHPITVGSYPAVTPPAYVAAPPQIMAPAY